MLNYIFFLPDGKIKTNIGAIFEYLSEKLKGVAPRCAGRGRFERQSICRAGAGAHGNA